MLKPLIYITLDSWVIMENTIPQIINDQLDASTVNGFPFFPYTGIKKVIHSGKDTLKLSKIPKNPNKLTAVNVVYNFGMDTYTIETYMKKDVIYESIDDVHCGEMAMMIAQKMGVY